MVGAVEKVYIESTIPSYLTARPSENVIATARQLLTQKWWSDRRKDFDLYTSDVALLECSRGDPDAANRRMKILQGIQFLEITPEVISLADKILEGLQIPDSASNDALHIAVACVHNVDYLLSWNFRHLVNATLIRRLNRLLGACRI